MEKEQKKQGGRRIILVGDSTMCDYSVSQYLRNLAPQEGWGMHLQAKCRNNAEVLNCASAGKSTRTYEKEGLWKQALAKIRKDDFVVIGMAINDAWHSEGKTSLNGEFEGNLRRWIAEVRKKKGIPVLTTSTVLWKKTGRKYYTGKIRKYNQAILDTASACHADCVDLCTHAFRKLKVMPNEDVCQIYMATSELPQKKGKDFCHFKGIGAEFYAELFVQLCKRKKLRIGEMFLSD